MKFSAVLKLAAAGLLTGALLIPSAAPAKAVTYPPKVSLMYVTPGLGGGLAGVGVIGEYLVPGIKVRATLGSKSITAPLNIHASGAIGTSWLRVSALMPSTAGRYTVNFRLEGAGANASTKQTYTVGKSASIKSLKIKKKSYGLSVSGKTAKKTPVKITVTIGKKTYTKTVKTNSSGSFSYKFTKKKSKGTYTVTAQISKNTKYFGPAVSKSYKRS